MNETQLLERLRADRHVGADAIVRSVTAHSRNTLIYRVRGAQAALVCKVERGTRRSWIEAEFRKLVELQERLAGSGLRSLVPVAVYPELGILVTREEPGESVRSYIDRGIAAASGSDARRNAEGLMEACADALFRFHRITGSSYTDFQPGNVLASPSPGGMEIILMDPPPRERVRPFQVDLGLFCFGVARAGFTPQAVVRRPHRWLDQLKARFVTEYFTRLGRNATATDIETIQKAERARARRAIRRYADFRRFPNWPLELVRLAYFGPVISLYVALHLPRSYRQVQACGS